MLPDMYAVKDLGLSPERPFVARMKRYPAPESAVHYDMHFCLEAGVLLSGSIRRVWRNCSIDIRPGQIWWVNAWEAHGRQVLAPGSEAVAFIFLPDALAALPSSGADWLGPFRSRPEARPQFRSPAARAEALDAGRSIWKLLDAGRCLAETRAWLRFLDLMCMAQPSRPRTSSERKARPSPTGPLAQAVALVRSRLPQRTSALEAAQVCRLSRSRFDALFRAAFGVSFGQFERRVRLAGAADDLKTRLQPVKVVARRWGFHDASHFCHTFSSVYGASPSVFQGLERAPSHTTDGVQR